VTSIFFKILREVSIWTLFRHVRFFILIRLYYPSEQLKSVLHYYYYSTKGRILWSHVTFGYLIYWVVLVTKWTRNWFGIVKPSRPLRNYAIWHHFVIYTWWLKDINQYHSVISGCLQSAVDATAVSRNVGCQIWSLRSLFQLVYSSGGTCPVATPHCTSLWGFGDEVPIGVQEYRLHVCEDSLSSIPGVKMIPFPPYKAPQTQSRLPSPTKTGYSDF